MMMDVDIIGVLAPEDYVLSKRDGAPVFINSQNSLQFLIKPVSETSETLSSIDLFTGYSSDFERYGFVDDPYLDPYKRIQSLKDFLLDRLVIFRAFRKGTYHHIKDVRLVPKPLAYYERSSYVPIPVFSQRKHGYTYEEFLNRLQNNRFLGRVEHMIHDSTPDFVLWEVEESPGYRSYLVCGPFEKHRYAHGGYCFTYKELKIELFSEDWFNDSVEVPKDESLYFIGFDTCQKINDYLSSKSPYNFGHTNENTIIPILEKIDFNEKSENDTEEPKENSYEQEEYDFLDKFLHITREQGFLYDKKDLINFHTAMKASNLVILAGMSGTGKSRLIDFYKKALGLADTQTNIIPVRPAWTDDADLIGYVDSIHMVYRPGDSGLINTLVEAAKEQNRNRLYIVCFDEMNLARVEHYFSQFLSVLELEPARRILRLYNDELEPRLYNAAQYPPSIKIGENVMFVGTVNIDESTYHFSDKVLDRANVITLNVLPFQEFKELSEQKRRRQEDAKEYTKGPKEDFREWAFEEYREIKKNKTDTLDLHDNELAFLKEIHEALNNTNRNLGVGFRIIRQIDAYIKNLPDNGWLDRSEAFDLQIIQRVITKVRGPEDQLKGLLGYPKNDGSVTGSKLLEIIDSYSEVSSFTRTRSILIRKAKELKIYGYTV